jgi:hypothetical protein
MIAWLKDNVYERIDFWPPAKQRRMTGMIFILGFAAIGALVGSWGMWRAEPFDSGKCRNLWMLGGGLGIGVLLPFAGRYVYCAIMAVAGLIGYVLTNILVVLLFAFFTIVGLGLRVLSKDLLDRRAVGRDATRSTAWSRHRPPPPNSQYHHLS